MRGPWSGQEARHMSSDSISKKKVIRLIPLIYNRGSRISARIDGEIIRIYRLSEILEVLDTGSLQGRNTGALVTLICKGDCMYG